MFSHRMPSAHLCIFAIDFPNNIIEIPLLGGGGHISSLHVAILTRLGVTIFKMPPSTAATVNQFPNPKVSDVEKEGEAEEGQGGHLLFLIRMDQSSSPFLSPFYLSISGTLFLFLSSLSSLYLPPPLSLCRILGPLQGISMAQRRAVTSKCHPGETRALPSFVFFHSATRLPFSCVGAVAFLVLPHLRPPKEEHSRYIPDLPFHPRRVKT